MQTAKNSNDLNSAIQRPAEHSDDSHPDVKRNNANDESTTVRTTAKHLSYLNSAVKRPAKHSNDSNPAVKRSKNETVKQTTKHLENKTKPFDEIFKDNKYNKLYKVYENEDPFFRHVNFDSFDNCNSESDNTESTLEIIERLRKKISGQNRNNKLLEDTNCTDNSKVSTSEFFEQTVSHESSTSNLISKIFYGEPVKKSNFTNETLESSNGSESPTRSVIKEHSYSSALEYEIESYLYPSGYNLFKCAIQKTTPKNTDYKSKNNCIPENSLNFQKDLPCLSWMYTDYLALRESDKNLGSQFSQNVSSDKSSKTMLAKSSPQKSSSSETLKDYSCASNKTISAANLATTVAKNVCNQVLSKSDPGKTIFRKAVAAESSSQKHQSSPITVQNLHAAPLNTPDKMTETCVQEKVIVKGESSQESETLKSDSSVPSHKPDFAMCDKSLYKQDSQNLSSSETFKVIVNVELNKLERVPDKSSTKI